MTIFDKDQGPQILNRFGQNLGGRSTGKFVFFGLVGLIALLLIGNFLLSATRIEGRIHRD